MLFIFWFAAVNSQCAQISDVKSIPSDCSAFKGTFAIAGLSDNYLQLSGLTSVALPSNKNGSMDLNNINADNLAVEIAHNLQLQLLSLPNLSKIDGDVLIYDNLMLQSLLLPKLEEFNGRLLMTANSQVFVRTVSNNVSSGVGPVFSAPSLSKAKGNLTFFDIGRLSLDSLREFEGDIRIEQAGLKELNLTIEKVSGTGTLALINNTHLETILVSNLKHLDGSLIIMNNPSWDGFESEDIGNLESVDGSVWLWLNGKNSTEVDSQKLVMEKLMNVRGSMKIYLRNFSDASIKNACDTLRQKYKTSGVVEGDFHCTSASAESKGFSLITEFAWANLCFGLVLFHFLCQ